LLSSVHVQCLCDRVRSSLSSVTRHPLNSTNTSILQADFDTARMIAASKEILYNTLNFASRPLVGLQDYRDIGAWQYLLYCRYVTIRG